MSFSPIAFLSSESIIRAAIPVVFSLIVPPTEKVFSAHVVIVSSVFFLVKRIISIMQIECVWRVVATRLSVCVLNDVYSGVLPGFRGQIIM
uniref:Uncharacterized protein n=1 Tax=Escherichia coli TaxID=562 RepID=A0A3G4RSX3_ECOLX|nr:hypothetical protein D0368_00046 [Escherichia coli]